MTEVNYTPEVKEPRIGASVTSLLIANFIAIVLALYEGWDLQELMIIYWSQSVIIGYFSFRRMRDLKDFSTQGVSSNGVRLQPTEKTKRSMSFFFALHYGAFHLAYLAFMFTDGVESLWDDRLFLALCVAAFLVNHWYSYVEHRQMDATRKPNIGTIMFFPYARILPMHLTIIAGGAFGDASTPVLLLFLGLKTLADVIMHKIEHAAWRKQNVSVENASKSLERPG
jgi:hypothetical protein